MDRISKEQRSLNMSAVHASGNKSTELNFIKLLRAQKIVGWRRHQKLYGKPDFVFLKKKIVVFIDGCFWHGCKKHRSILNTRKEFWTLKINGNKRRDREVNYYYRKNGWNVVRIWEHQIKDDKKIRELSILKILK